ncbi:MAG: sugar phosphate isomerase/epimerase [Chloroflexi bacterium]|nr:sugar phosphate isomerase/epimerase [Chloroflexota bacterium]
MNSTPRLHKGLRDGCLGGETPVPEIFRLAGLGGFEGVELTLPADGPFSLRATDAERHELRRLATDGPPIFSLNAGLPWQYSASSLDQATRTEGQALVRSSIDLAADLGVDTLLYIPGVVTDDQPFTEVWDAARAATEALLPQAEQAGVTLAVENVWNALILSPRDMLEFVDGFASPSLRVYFDVGNVMQFGRPQHWIEALGADRIARVHVKDFTLRPGGWLGFTQLLHGDVDWPVVMQTLRRVGYSGWITPEVSPSSAAPEAWVAELSAAMDTIIGYYEA